MSSSGDLQSKPVVVDKENNLVNKEAVEPKTKNTKSVPKARKSCNTKPIQSHFPGRIQLKEIEKTFGISKSFNDLDAKTIDKLILSKTKQFSQKDSSRKSGGQVAKKSFQKGKAVPTERNDRSKQTKLSFPVEGNTNTTETVSQSKGVECHDLVVKQESQSDISLKGNQCNAQNTIDRTQEINSAAPGHDEISKKQSIAQTNTEVGVPGSVVNTDVNNDSSSKAETTNQDGEVPKDSTQCDKTKRRTKRRFQKQNLPLVGKRPRSDSSEASVLTDGDQVSENGKHFKIKVEESNQDVDDLPVLQSRKRKITATIDQSEKNTESLSPQPPELVKELPSCSSVDIAPTLDSPNVPKELSVQEYTSADGIPVKYMNTPDGISYPVTPPHTPEGSINERSSGVPPSCSADVLQVCHCCVPGVSLKETPKHTIYCSALDYVNDKVVGCLHKVSKCDLFRASARIPFMFMCEDHHDRLRQHQCCPGCGHFCTQGKFFVCGNTEKPHYFHQQCQVYESGKYHCPHCGAESNQQEALLDIKLPQQSFSQLDNKRARLSCVYPSSGDSQVSEVVNNSFTVVKGSAKTISSEHIPVVPIRKEIESVMKLLDPEKIKKHKGGPKNLYHAARNEDLEKIIAVLAEGYNPNTKYPDYDHKTCLHMAAIKGNMALLYLLSQVGATLNIQDEDDTTPMMEAAENGHLGVIKFLVLNKADHTLTREDGMTAFHIAAQEGHLDIVKYFVLDLKMDVNLTDDGGWTAITWAAEHNHIDVVRFLISEGGDPTFRDNEENTALHWAAFSGNVEIAVIFLDSGCDAEVANIHGDRALHLAARQGHYKCVMLLLARGADCTARNNETETPQMSNGDEKSMIWMSLQISIALKEIRSRQNCREEVLLHRDISLGREEMAIQVWNSADDESYPTDFVYIKNNVETKSLNINRTISSLQHCKCGSSCGSNNCMCTVNSIRCWYDEEGRLIPEFNKEDPPLIYECNQACQCWSTCRNRVVQLGITSRLQVFKTKGRGWGCRSAADIKEGSFVCEYVGEHISDAEADSREDDSYLFDLDNKDSDTFCIDARRYANVARFINHLCEPNLIPVKVFIEHQDQRFPRICFFASRNIKRGEELGFDYGEKFWIIKYKQFTCECGHPKCKYSKEQIGNTLKEYNRRQQQDDLLED